MAATTTTQRPARSRRGRGSNRAAGSAGSHDNELDLLTAALIGLAIGATATLLLRRGPGGSRPIEKGLSLAGRGAQLAGVAGWTGAKAAGRAAARGVESIPFEDIGDNISDYLRAAKDAIEDTVSHEVDDLKKAVRRRRRRLGL